jgi:hypothetical protein
MLIENKSSSYSEIKTRKRELCAPYKPLCLINQNTMKESNYGNKNPLCCPDCDDYRYLEFKGVRFSEDQKSLGMKIPFFDCRKCDTSTPIVISPIPIIDNIEEAQLYYKKIADEHLEKLENGKIAELTNGLSNKKFEQFSSIDFEYDSLDYYYIPGLTREWNEGFLTPVFFNKELLLFYNSNTDYKVKFSSTSRFYIIDKNGVKLISHGFGINRNGNIICWLGDLEEELSKEENKFHRNLFLTFNIKSDHDIVSDYYFNQIESNFTSSDNETGVFHYRNEFDTQILKKFNFEITQVDIDKLIEEYKHPIINEQSQLENSFIKLNSLLTESLNVTEIKKSIIQNGSTKESIKGLKGLKLFEQFLRLVLNKDDSSNLVSPLFVLYDLRLLAGHIKDSNYNSKIKSCKERLNLTENATMIETHQTLCVKLIEMYKELTNN